MILLQLILTCGPRWAHQGLLVFLAGFRRRRGDRKRAIEKWPGGGAHRAIALAWSRWVR